MIIQDAQVPILLLSGTCLSLQCNLRSRRRFHDQTHSGTVPWAPVGAWNFRSNKSGTPLKPIITMVKFMLLLAFFNACPHLELGGYHRVPLVEFSAWTVPSYWGQLSWFLAGFDCCIWKTSAPTQTQGLPIRRNWQLSTKFTCWDFKLYNPLSPCLSPNKTLNASVTSHLVCFPWSVFPRPRFEEFRTDFEKLHLSESWTCWCYSR